MDHCKSFQAFLFVEYECCAEGKASHFFTTIVMIQLTLLTSLAEYHTVSRQLGKMAKAITLQTGCMTQLAKKVRFYVLRFGDE